LQWLGNSAALILDMRMLVDQSWKNVFPCRVNFRIAGSGPFCDTASHSYGVKEHHLSDVVSLYDDVRWTGRWRSIAIDDRSIPDYESRRSLAVNWRSRRRLCAACNRECESSYNRYGAQPSHTNLRAYVSGLKIRVNG